MPLPTDPAPEASPTPAVSTSARQGFSPTVVVVLCVLLGLGFRALSSYRSSFWLDELHSLGHGVRRSIYAT